MRTLLSTLLFVTAVVMVVPAQSTATLASLAALTVPAASLPDGCELGQPTPVTTSGSLSGTRVINGVIFPFANNPWQGSETKSAVTVFNAVYLMHPSHLPDAPPLTTRETAVLDVKRVEHVHEAYHADYVAADHSRVVVDAVTFDDVKFVPAEPLSVLLASARGVSTRLFRGATVVVVRSPATNACGRAVDAYVRSTK